MSGEKRGLVLRGDSRRITRRAWGGGSRKRNEVL